MSSTSVGRRVAAVVAVTVGMTGQDERGVADSRCYVLETFQSLNSVKFKLETQDLRSTLCRY